MKPEPFTFVIFGATGDLTQRRLLPAVYSLFRESLLPEEFSIVAFARREKDDVTFRNEMRAAVETFSRVQPFDPATWDAFAARMHYHRSSFDDAAGFTSLRQRLDDSGTANALFYFATPPDQFGPLIDQLDAAGLAAQDNGWRRVIVEKPFGRDLATAQELNRRVQSAFTESQIYRIDHYLGKETVQNLLVLRFANSIFEPIWNQKYVDHVQITVSETVGVGDRGGYYDQAGALRDMIQNHAMQLLSLVAMEAPVSLAADRVRDEKVKVLKSLRTMSRECVSSELVRAQYAAGESAAGYLEEDGVAPGSTTETYVALKAFIDNWRWAGVPFYLRTGKRMPVRLTDISIHFKPVPQVLFNAPPIGPMEPNVLGIRIQPNEGIMLKFQVKTPGPAMNVQPLKMDFGYAEMIGREPPEAYERLLLDAALGDSTLFTRSDEVEAAWSFVGPILDGCAELPATRLPQYAAGTWGPKEADDLLAADGRQWQIMKRRVHRGGDR